MIDNRKQQFHVLAGRRRLACVSDHAHRQKNEAQSQENLAAASKQGSTQEEKADATDDNKSAGKVLQVKRDKLNYYGQTDVGPEDYR